MQARSRPLLAGFLVLLAAVLGLPFTPLAETLNHQLLDLQFRALRGGSPQPAAVDVAVVGIDEETYRGYREPVALWHPHLGRLFAALAAGGPAVVGLDLVLPDKSYDFLVPGHDRQLLAGVLALKRAAPLVLGQTVDERGRLRPLFAPIVSVAGDGSLGLVVVEPDSDRVVRRYTAQVATGGGDLPTLAAAMAGRLGAQTAGGIIDYATGAAFGYVPMQQLIAWHEAGDHARLRTALAGKAVLVGAILPFEDRHALPVALAAWEPGNRVVPGVLIHAQALRALAGRGLIRPAAAAWAPALAALSALLWWVARRPVAGAVAAAAALVVLAGVSTVLLSRGVYLPVAGAGVAVLLAVVGRVALESVAAAAERMRLRQSFGSYVSPGVMDEILAGRLTPGTVGERRRVCVLFSDIRSFTTRSESQPPEAIIALLNEYFDEMTAAVHRHGGTVDKFIGDGLMCFFGAPGVMDSPARSAFDSAREMMERLARLNERLAARGIEAVAIGVGLHVGDAVVGHVGSVSRHEYTVIGDTVNIAARLEGLTKGLGCPVACSAEVARELGPDAGLDDLGSQTVKGRAAVHVYGWRGGVVGTSQEAE